MPTVSVIVPNYNHAPYLKRRIDSILAQTYQDFELILLDDKSSDKSAEIIQSYADNPKVSHIVINETNSGSTFKQWDKGFSLAIGKYIWIAESDDWCEPTLLESLIPALEADSSISLAFCQCQLIDETEAKLFCTSGYGKDTTLSGKDFVREQMFGDMVIVNAGMAVFRKSALEEIDPTYKTMRAAGDWRFWIEIALKGNVFISDKVLAYCFRHSGTVTSKSVACGNDIVEGNANFKYVLDNASPSRNQLINALKLRARIFLGQKNLYDSKETLRKSRKRILGLHPLSPIVYSWVKIKGLFCEV